MGVWFLAVLLTGLCCAALYYAAARAPVNAATGERSAAAANIYAAQLSEIDRDLGNGAISAEDADAARAEIGREFIRQGDEPAVVATPRSGRRALWIGLPAIAVVAFATYAVLGHPELPGQPAAGRPEFHARAELNRAIADVETQLRAHPDDLRGWQVIAPVYLRLGRYAEAVDAFRRIMALDGQTPDHQTDLAEALMFASGEATGEALALLKAAADADPTHARSRFYLAGEATHAGRYAEAAELWTAVLALSSPDDPWVPLAQEGLSAARAGVGSGAPAGTLGPNEQDIAAAAEMSAEDRQAMISGMVEGLSARLASQGGTPAEWAQLVRARLVQGRTDQARLDYEAGLASLTDPADRTRLTDLATEAGLAIGVENTP